MTCVASVDIGYGNLKAVWGPLGSEPAGSLVLPVGAAPTKMAAKGINNSIDAGQGAVVLVDGTEWVAGVSPLELQGFARPTHENYPRTNEYLALFYAALAKIGAPEIDALVTGLPVSQYYDTTPPAMTQHLIKRLQGEHYVRNGLMVNVKKVLVVPQPIGAFRSYLSQNRGFAKETDALTLVVDIGFYSVDWAVLRGQKVLDQFSGSSVLATSRVLEQASEQITLANPGLRISQSRLESAFRDGRDRLTIGTTEIDYMTFLNAAAREIADKVCNVVSSDMRGLGDSLDQVLVTGGGATLFYPSLKSVYGKNVFLGDSTVTANAYGFWKVACQLAKTTTDG